MTRAVVLLTDENLREVGHPITRWTRIEVERPYNAPGCAVVTTPADPTLMRELVTPGRRAVLLYRGEYYCGGPIERPAEPFEWTADADGINGVGQVTFAFADDLASVVSRLTVPDPSLTPEDDQQPEAWTMTDTGETVMRALVSDNCITPTGAVEYRKVPSLVLGSAAGVGGTISFRTRFEPLGDALRRAALLAGGLGFRTRQTSGAIEFQVFEPADRTGDVRFSRGLGNLRGIHLTVAAPTVSDAIVGGGGEGADRLIVRRTNLDARPWGVYETFVDQRHTEDTTEMADAGDEALDDGQEAAELSLVTVARPGQPIPAVGDLVTVELWPGHELRQVVRADHLEIDADSELLTLTVGTANADPDPEWVKRVRALAREMHRLETI